MKTKNIMVQGTASSVGKSILCAALCRIFMEDGYCVSPFKAQNMSLNSFITPLGGEMGRAQAVQAQACNKIPHTDMNPILLKPSSDKRSQIILHGKVVKSMGASAYYREKYRLMPEILKAYHRLEADSDIIVIEGAGSPAEINLRKNDIVNMGLALAIKSPVLLVGDIDKGGVFASLLGTILLLSKEERSLIKGVIINKFRGDVSLLKPGLATLEEMTGIPVLGVVPMLDVQIEEEDGQALCKACDAKGSGALNIAVVQFPYISNFTDIEALSLEPDTNVYYAKDKKDIEKAHIIILPGTKSTMKAVSFLREKGLGDAIVSACAKGVFVFGICGGYQSMGKEIQDPHGVESDIKQAWGLGLIDSNTVFTAKKRTAQAEGLEQFFGTSVKGYEIHMGFTEETGGCIYPFIQTAEGGEGFMSQDKKCIGTYFHGIFDNGAFVRYYLNFVRKSFGLAQQEGELVNYHKFKQEQFVLLAEHVRKALDMEKIYKIVSEES